MPTALLTGITGQDGSYLAELLLDKGYTVHGIIMVDEMIDPAQRLFRIHSILDRITLHSLDLLDFEAICGLVRIIKPDECYHLAAQSFVSYSLENEFGTLNTNIHGTHNILSSLKTCAPNCRFFFAASSEIFGVAQTSPQDEATPYNPRSIYGVSKTTGFFLSRNYRNTHHLFACNGILYNHESERRGIEFVTRKITAGAAGIKLGKIANIRLGNLDARRDWGYAPDYVRGMWLMLQQESPDDYVLGTGITHSVKDFLSVAFGTFDLDWQKYVLIDPELIRPVDEVEMRADPRKAEAKLGWKAEVGFEELVQRMALADYARLQS
jgi:GDPmannose 4,6-dehydratase